MSLFSTPPGGSRSGPASSPDAVIKDLKEQAERKAAFRMFYSAADVFREYKGPYSAETAAERARLTEEYDQRGRDAEKQRLEGGPRPVAAKPPTAPRPLNPILRPTTPKPAAPAGQAKPGVRTPVPPKPRDNTPAPVFQGDKVSFQCRWCKETITFLIAEGGQILRCQKCDCLISVPKATA
jgi:hypothetical protein